MTVRHSAWLLEVLTEPVGSSLVEPAAGGDTVLQLADAVDFQTDGGIVDINGARLSFASADPDADTITLATPLVAPVDVDDLVQVWDVDNDRAMVNVIALVELADAGESDDDPIRCRVNYGLSVTLAEGARPYRGETVVVEEVDGAWSLIDVVGIEPVVFGGYLAPGTVPKTSFDPDLAQELADNETAIDLLQVDLAAAAAAVAALQDGVENAQASADGKTRVWYQDTPPAGADHKVDDTWFDTNDGNRIYRWNGSTWAAAPLGGAAIAPGSIAAGQLASTINDAISSAQTTADAAQTAADGAAAAAAGAQATANGKSKIFMQSTTPTAVAANDIWIDPGNGNVVKVATAPGTGNWVTRQDAAIQAAADAATAAQGTADGKNRVTYSTSAPTVGSPGVPGDLWFVRSGSVITSQFLCTAGTGTTSGNTWQSQTISNSVIASLDAAKITTGTLDALRIGVNSITANHIAADAVTASELAAGAVTTAKLAAGAVTANEIAASTITAAKIAAATIDASRLVAGTITAASGIIGNAAIGTAQIIDGSITTAKIGAAQITNALIADATIQSAKIAALDAAKITTGTLDAARIGADAITAVKIAAGAVTAAKIAAGTITANEIAAGAVTAGKVAAGAIDGMVITGATLRTAAAGRRWELASSPNNSLVGFSGLSGERAPGSLTIDSLTFNPEIPAIAQTYAQVKIQGYQTFAGQTDWPAPMIELWTAVKDINGKPNTSINMNSTGIQWTDDPTGNLTNASNWITAGRGRRSDVTGGINLTSQVGISLTNDDVSSAYIDLYTNTFHVYSVQRGAQGDELATFQSTPSITFMRQPGLTEGNFGHHIRCIPTDVQIYIDSPTMRLAQSFGGGLLRLPVVNAATTTTAAANMFINSTAHNVARSTSMRAAKLAIEPISAADALALLDVDVVTWFDRAASEAYAASITEADDEARDRLLSDMTVGLRRIPGLVAEDVDAAAPLFATHDSDGNLTGVAYDRVGVAWIPAYKHLLAMVVDQQEQITQLKNGAAA